MSVSWHETALPVKVAIVLPLIEEIALLGVLARG